SLPTAYVLGGCRRFAGGCAAPAAVRVRCGGTADGPAGRAAAVIEYCPPWPGVAPGTRNPAVEWEGRSAQRGEEGGTAAEVLLRRTVLTDSTLATVGNAVRCLMHAGRPEAAGHWADVFVREAERRGADGWYATFAGIKAELALLTGDLPAAERYARRGIDRLPKQKLGALAGGLIAAQVLALTQMGEYEAGARWFEQPVPDDLLTSEYGLTYLRSRGCYHLVTNRLSSALNDFLAVGRRVRDWGIDQPQWIPWRGDAAEALLRLGETTEAEQLLSEQLALLPAGHDRVQGITLRLFSATVDVRRRPALLVRAVALLQSSGDRLQLAHALGELAESYRWLGEGGRAWAALSRAKELAEECGAGPLCDSLRSQEGLQGEEEPGDDCCDGGGDDDRVPRVVAEGVMGNQWDGGWRTRLSNSEKRVAALAAGGHTNRDISSQLHITVSTVEQHLTRIYRKLRIRGRDQLPVDLQFRDDPAKSTPCRTLP
ncbi:helix-turn-helix transcriptional regulator, partial [Streptomyces sp. NPDC047315]|uniref:helix-turn-helix transcriptional regulator n=1 Tax=Streptomyces sp. NPDC047315 TaxID=3155142 RepID=UPI0033C16539